jgi:hypothetical protein
MNSWLRRIRGAVVFGVVWALAWAPVGVLVGMALDPDDRMDEPWLIVGMLPGFLGGVLFSIVLGIAARHRRFEELSVRRFAAWGAVAGLMVGILPFALGDPATPELGRRLASILIPSITLMCSA